MPTLYIYGARHDDVIKWKHFPCYWPFVRWIHWSPVNSPHKASDVELWCFLWSAPWINGWVNNREAGDLRRHRAHYDVTTMNFVITVPADVLTPNGSRPWTYFSKLLWLSMISYDLCDSRTSFKLAHVISRNIASLRTLRASKPTSIEN